jgi:cytochrome P450
MSATQASRAAAGSPPSPSSTRERLGRLLLKIQPWLLRSGERVFGPLRRFRPVLRIRSAVILTRHEDVRQVLERDDVFSVTYGEHMEAVTGPFILGWDDGPRYQHEVGALRAAVRREDLPAVASLTTERARAVVPARGVIDAVTLADEIVGAGLADYFGLPELAGPADREAARDVFRAVFLDAETPATRRAGERASARLVAVIEAAMADARLQEELPGTVLGRLLAGSLDDEAIPRNLVGLVAAWAASVPRAFSLALDVLLDHPPELARASAAAAAGDEDTVAGLWIEALRLQPQAPFLIRKARGPMVIAPGSPREEHIKAGDIVVAVTESAMRDRHVLEAPSALLPGRPSDDILHFGAGLHRCFGAAISRAQFGAAGTVLLRDRTVRRAGPLAWGPAYPASLPVEVRA